MPLEQSINLSIDPPVIWKNGSVTQRAQYVAPDGKVYRSTIFFSTRDMQGSKEELEALFKLRLGQAGEQILAKAKLTKKGMKLNIVQNG